ncbi:hypothetical protein PIB30_004209 [Stylosanthes scabra]|uniref:F-box protein n=1 Tax=Stylosanthes scabra TaxID=79078 RepID=A0ABU6R4S6_9FABA|nr:hypothetical protein [Stylosanthes scabra]
MSAIGVLRNCLSFCLDHKKTHWAVWLLNNQSWTKLAMVTKNSISTVHDGICLRPVYIIEDDVLLAIGPDRKLHLVYLNDGRMVSLMIYRSSDDAVESPMSPEVGGMTGFVYYPSLVSPLGMVHFNPTSLTFR